MENENSINHLLVEISKMHRELSFNYFNELGLHQGQPPILFMLWKKDGLTQKEIAEGRYLKPASVTDALQRMEKSGLIERKQDDLDMRITRVYLTQKGKDLEPQVLDKINIIQQKTFDGFTTEEIILLRRFFIQIKENLIEANNN